MSADRRILLVEDDVLIGMMLVDMLDALGFAEPAQATSVADALAMLATQPFAAALVDINLGGVDVMPPAHSHRQLVSKPFRLSEIETVLNDFFA